MKYKSPVYSQASGSIAGITYSRNKGGLYTRARAIPTNPNTLQQQVVRNLMGQLSNNWSQVLTETQRAEWNIYAANVPLVDNLGDPINVAGLNMYTRSNIARLQAANAALPRVDDGPVDFTLGEFTPPVADDVDSTAEDFDISFANTDQWANETGSAMLLYMSRPMQTTINYFNGPYQFAGSILGDDTTAPTSPATFANVFPYGVGQRAAFRAVVTRVDGRLSSPFRFSVVST